MFFGVSYQNFEMSIFTVNKIFGPIKCKVLQCNNSTNIILSHRIEMKEEKSHFIFLTFFVSLHDDQFDIKSLAPMSFICCSGDPIMFFCVLCVCEGEFCQLNLLF